MKRTDPARLTEATLMRAVLERGGKPVAIKTLTELEALGRPPRPAVETMCESLIERGYLVPAVAAKGNGVQATTKEHPALWALLLRDVQAAGDAAQALAATSAQTDAREKMNTAVFLKRLARETRCAWTRSDDDLFTELAAAMDAWIAKKWDTPPRWVQKRRASVQALCKCFDCQEYGGERRREHYRTVVQEPPAPDPALDPIEEAMTSEQEASLRTQHELQADVETLAAGQQALAAQVAALLQQGANGTQP